MIITKLKGGLGNQMFQYAIGRSLAERNNTNLKIDKSWYDQRQDSSAERPFNIEKFEAKCEIASQEEIHRTARFGESGFRWAYRLDDRIPDRFWSPTSDFFRVYIEEPFINGAAINEKRTLRRPQNLYYYPSMLDIGDNAYLDGYWQAKSYFENIGATIKADFALDSDVSPQTEATQEQIADSESVSIHIRRGDFVDLDWTLSLQYYRNAVDLISEKIDKPTFFIFSDDPEWAENNIDIEYETTYVSHNTAETDYEDLYLMKKCDHHIVANSTFSWWGAWLNESSEKIVVSPEQWQEIPVKKVNLIPKNWETIDSK